jgi:ABC-type branched-subunit amino acid transport system ATPase component
VATPWLPVAVIGFGIGLGASSALVPALVVLTFSVVEPRARPAAGVLIALFMFLIGGLLGSFLLGGLDRRFGAAVAIGVLAIPTCFAAALLRRAASTINGDLDRLLDQVLESEEVAVVVRSGGSMPLLACRHIDFSYGQLQVLFDVNFSVDDGEIVALLGTNGAGKSTLLRVICGLGLPSRGSVRLAGRDITHIDTERRVSQGISQVPGGRAVFAPMSVLDNLRVLGYTHGRDRRSVEAGIEASFAAFPRLAERHNQAAATLSGGEQQMLGLATAFITRPRLLLIDELSHPRSSGSCSRSCARSAHKAPPSCSSSSRSTWRSRSWSTPTSWRRVRSASTAPPSSCSASLSSYDRSSSKVPARG